jgi:Fe-Mn family superoxide dismutase
MRYVILIASFFTLLIQSLCAEIIAKDYSNLWEKMPKISKELIDVHLKLYNGYVSEVNALSNKLKDSNLDPFTYQSIKRRYGWEYDGVLLHELYFDNLGGDGKIDKKSNLYKKLTAQFGSFDKFLHDFKNTMKTRGIGWVVLYWDPKQNAFFNAWITEHDTGPFMLGDPILVIDVWEHAYLSQFKTDRVAYADVIFEYVNWDLVSKRYSSALREDKK